THAMCTRSVAGSRRAPERLRRERGLLPRVLGIWVLGILSGRGVSERDRVFGRRLPLSALLLPLRKLSLQQLLRERELLGRRPQRPRRARPHAPAGTPATAHAREPAGPARAPARQAGAASPGPAGSGCLEAEEREVAGGAPSAAEPAVPARAAAAQEEPERSVALSR